MPNLGVERQQDIYVVHNLRRALLGKQALEALNIVALVEPIQEPDIVKQFSKVFNCLGKLNGSYTIKLKENATPFALNTPRRVATHTTATQSQGGVTANGEHGGHLEH